MTYSVCLSCGRTDPNAMKLACGICGGQMKAETGKCGKCGCLKEKHTMRVTKDGEKHQPDAQIDQNELVSSTGCTTMREIAGKNPTEGHPAALDKVRCYCKRYRDEIVRAGPATDQEVAALGMSASPQRPNPNANSPSPNPNPVAAGPSAATPTAPQTSGHPSHQKQLGQAAPSMPSVDNKRSVPDHLIVSGARRFRSAMVSKGGSIYGSFLQKPVIQPGVANWWRLLGSQVLDVEKDMHMSSDPAAFVKKLEDFDLVYVNASGTDIGLVSRLRDALGDFSSTKLLLINDYSLDYIENILEGNKTPLHKYVRDFMAPDVLLAQEPFEYEFMKYLIRENEYALGRKGITEFKSPVIGMAPHPCQTKELKELSCPLPGRVNQVSFIYHRYDGHTDIPSLLLRGLPPTWFTGYGPSTAMFGYTYRKNMMGDDRYFDSVYDSLEWGRYVQHQNLSIASLEYSTVHSMSRFSAECACLRIPLVSTHNSFLSTVLFPDLSHPHIKLRDMRDSLNRVTVDEEYWKKVTDFAWEKVEEFNYDRSYERLKKILEEVR